MLNGFTRGVAYVLVFLLAISIVPVFAQEFPQPSSELCAPYRKNDVVQSRIAEYFGRRSPDPKDPATYRWLDVWFNPDYENNRGLAGLPNPDGSPKDGLYLDLHKKDGSPLPESFLKHRISPRWDDYFRLLIRTHINYAPLSRAIRIFGNLKVSLDHSDIPAIEHTGEFAGGMERFNIPGALPVGSGDPAWENKIRSDWYADISPEGGYAALMECDLPGSVPVPHCHIFEKSRYFEMHISGIRRTQMDQVPAIRKHARNFTACLTWKGE